MIDPLIRIINLSGVQGAPCTPKKKLYCTRAQI